jgi:hypothetical protein
MGLTGAPVGNVSRESEDRKDILNLHFIEISGDFKLTG